MKRLLALLLACALVLGSTGCMAPQESAQKQPEQNANLQETTPQDIADMVESGDRESLEEIVDLLGGETEKSATTEELGQLAQELLTQLETEKVQNTIDSGSSAPSVELKAEAYDEDGAMKEPFDVVYPELVENGSVEFDDETLLIKLASDKLTDGLQAAGVAALAEVVPLVDCAWYQAKLVAGTDAKSALETVRQLKEVLLAEYNYTIQTAAVEDYQSFDQNSLFGDQWHMQQCGIPAAYGAMQNEAGAGMLVAVIDTGVDYDHEDLKENIWVNTAEIPDNGRDDDGNGYVDDYYGYNAVTGSGSADDDNGHGTHVAGIIAAQNNNLGVVGLAYKAKIMPIKAANHSGYLHQTDIAKAVMYAYENGADVINMSFGGTACSIAVQDALALAYTRCVLVASAGNSGAYNEGIGAIPNYPAALTYVLGVMSVDQYGVESSFTNWDVFAFNGREYEVYAPGEMIMSTLPNDQYGQLSGTSMAAPTVAAMAAILRSEFTDRDTYSTKFIYGQLASTSEIHAECYDPSPMGHGSHNMPMIADLHAALTKMPKPDVNYQDYALFDDPKYSDKNNGDGIIDAGETIALGFTLRNRWGMSQNTIVTIDTLVNGLSDPYIEILEGTVNYGSVGTYSTQDAGRIYTDELLSGWENPFLLKIAEDCPNDYLFDLHVTVTCENGLNGEDTRQYKNSATVTEAVRNGVILPQVIEKDMVLTKDNLYVISNSTLICQGATVRVEPGTHIQFWTDDPNDPYADKAIAFLVVQGKFLVEGTKEEPVYIYPSELMSSYNVEICSINGGYTSLRYADITNLGTCDNNAGGYNTINLAEHCTFRNNSGEMRGRYEYGGIVHNSSNSNYFMAKFGVVRDSIFYKVGTYYGSPTVEGDARRCIFVECSLALGQTSDYVSDTYFSAQDCVFLGNSFRDQTEPNAINNLEMMVMGYGLSTEYVARIFHEESSTVYLTTDREYAEFLLEKLDVSSVTITDEAHLQWLAERLAYYWYYDIGLRYDETLQQIVFADGTQIPQWLDPNNLRLSQENSGKLYLCRDYGMGNIYLSCYDPAVGYSISALLQYVGDPLMESITHDGYHLKMDMENTLQLQPKSAPIQYAPDYFTYISSDESVLTVSESGLVTPVSLGTADVRILSADGAISNFVTIAVSDYVAPESLSFADMEWEVAVGERLVPKCLLTPLDTTRTVITYTSADENILTVDAGGNLVGVSAGTVEVTAACENLTATVTVTVYNKATQLQLANSSISVALADETAQLPQVLTSAGGETKLAWSVMDPKVAKVEDGEIKLLAAGLTTLTVTDLRSGLTASTTLMVNEEGEQRVREILSTGSYVYALMEDGQLFTWNCYNPGAPVKVTDGVQDIGCSDAGLAIVKENGELVCCEDGVLGMANEQFTDMEIAQVCATSSWRSFSNLWVINTEGQVYVRGNDNSGGILGVGHGNDVYEPTLLPFTERICQVSVYGSLAFYLSESGNLYCSGGNVLQAYEPQLIARNVTYLDERGEYFITEGKFWSLDNYSTEPQSFALDLAGHTILDLDMSTSYNYNVLSMKDNQLYFTHFYKGYYDEEADIRTHGVIFGNVENVKTAYTVGPYNGIFAITQEGMLYGAADEWASGYLAAMTSENTVSRTEPLMIPVVRAQEELAILQTNLQGDGLLQTDCLELVFNKNIANFSGKLIESGITISLSATIEGNRVKVTSPLGIQPNTEYKLRISAAETAGRGSVLLPEDVEIYFLYVPEETAEPDVEADHPSVLDPNVVRYNARDLIGQQIDQLGESSQYNPDFYGNAVLNPISTDTDVTHWLRIKAQNSGGTYRKTPLGGNYWGSVNEEAIKLQMLDYTDFITYNHLQYAPFLTEAPENTFPFVTSVSLYNSAGEKVTVVGNETVTVRITFNRDMDTSIPLLVRFGSAFPYGDHEIEGQYVDARTWEAEYTFKTIIENGYQFWTISDGCSATEDLELQIDRARFGFEIDTTAAQALIMQGVATETGVQLSWTQDDFDTLMGYNVYRSTSEDGYYERLNKTTIPANTMQWLDTTVEPATRYYYNFTVVTTELTESEPSGKISLMSRDTMAPGVYHSPVGSATAGMNKVISAVITDNLTVQYANLYYRAVGESTWRTVRMNSLNDKYTAVIPASHLDAAGVEYYIEAFDGVSSSYSGTAEEPHVMTVKEPLNKDSLGDVDGNGVVNALDALLLLQAINDKYNMSEDEFRRADLNGDKELNAVEALRILHYVTGKVGSLDMT